MTALRLIFASTALALLLAAFAAFLPVKNYGVAPTKHGEPADALEKKTGFRELAQQFDRSSLPKPAPPITTAENAGVIPAKPDPKEVLDQNRYLGMADSDGREAAIFAKGEQTFLLKPGENIDGFTLKSLNGSTALFEKEGQDFRLQISPER